MYPISQPVAVTLGPAALAVTPRPHHWMSHPGWVPTGALAEEEPRTTSTLGAPALGAGAQPGAPRPQGLIPADPNTHFAEPVLQMDGSKI